MATKKHLNMKSLRKSTKLNQFDFWHPLGVTQSGGSRYESGRTVPKPVRMLIALLHGNATVDQLKAGQLAKVV